MNIRSIELSSMDSVIANTVNNERGCVGSEHTGCSQYICTDEAGEISVLTAKVDIARSLLGDGHPEMSASEATGFRMVGVKRRGRFAIRRFQEAEMHDVRRGDRVIVEDEKGEQIITPSINRIPGLSR